MAQYVLQPVGHDPYDATPVSGDPFGMVETPGALPLTSQDQASRMVDQGTRALTPLADSLGSAASLLGRALYGPEAAGWDRYGPARPEEALNAAGWVTMPGLGRAAVALPAERGLGEVLSSGGIKPPVVPAPAPEGLGPSLTAYHGSPHDFDKFDISKIGTGEGAQAYGHGLYFAGNEGVARNYRDILGRGDQITVGGKPVTDMAGDYYDQQARNWVQTAAKSRPDGPIIDDAISRAQAWADRMEGQKATQSAISARQTVDRLQNWKQQGVEVANPGSMYQVQINADPEHFLDWDKPLSEQHPKVQEAINQMAAQHGVEPDLSISGADAYHSVANNLADPNVTHWNASVKSGGPNAAEKLRDAGIPGIKYLDAGSRVSTDTQKLIDAQGTREAALALAQKRLDQTNSGTGGLQAARDRPYWQQRVAELSKPGTSNYVTFSDDIISILKKYGLAGLGIGTGAAAMQGQPDQSQ